jgi:hypothetical protein
MILTTAVGENSGCGFSGIGGDADYTPIIIPGAAHNLTIQWESGVPFFWWHVVPGYTDLLTAWVRARFGAVSARQQ